MSEITKLVPMPNKASVNGGKSPCPTSFIERKYGRPRAVITKDCKMPTSPFWKSRMVTVNVGPFKVTGHKLAVTQLHKALRALKERKPHIYNALGHVGMVCVRWVRGSTTSISNHSFGLAIDFTLEGILDVRGDGKVQKGLLELYQVMKEFGFYWGVEFGDENIKYEDAMHFELCGEFVMEAIRKGEF